MEIDNIDLDELEETFKTIPDSVQEFIDKLDELPTEFRMNLKRTGGGETGVIKSIKFPGGDSTQFEFDYVGANYGPGKYQWNISWTEKEKGVKGKAKQVSKLKSFTKELAPDVYQDIWETNMRAKQRRKDTVNGKESGLTAFDVSSLASNQINTALKLAKEFKPPPQVVPTQNNTDFTGMLSIMQQQSSENNKIMMTIMSTMMSSFTGMMTAMMSKPQNNTGVDTMGMFDKVFGIVNQVVDLKQALAPQEKDGVVDKIVDLFSKNLTHIVDIFKIRAEERHHNLMYKAVTNSSELQEIQDNPQMKMELVQKLADKMGLESTQQIVSILGWSEFENEISEAIRQEGTQETEVEEKENPVPTE